jgi:hypothetical protein
MPIPPAPIRLVRALASLRRAAILAAALTMLLCTLLPAAAPGARAHKVNLRGKRSIASETCSPKRGKKSSNRGRRARRCIPVAHPLRTAPAIHAPIEATSLIPVESQAGAATPSPAPGAPTDGTPPSVAPEPGPGGVVTDPIDSKYLTSVPFGRMSFWVQPWRAYLDTWPASHLLDSVGINFNVKPAFADATAQLLQDDGFKYARISMSWSGLSYTEPTKFRPYVETGLLERLTALHAHGLRPLIVLDAYSVFPTPFKQLTLETLAPAPAGAQTVTLAPGSAAQVVPGKTGFNGLTFEGSPDVLITSVTPEGVATLSRPLRSELPAGAHPGTTLLYAPFGAPTLPNGQPNPEFEATLSGWLSYVGTVSKLAASVVGPGGFDLEVWNELAWGSQFLNSENYYTPEPETPGEAEPGPEPEPATTKPAKKVVSKLIRKALLNATVAYVRSPLSGASPAVGITNGFASQTPFPSGAAAPLGLTALSKHPYVGLRSFPESYDVSALRPVNALGVQDTKAKELAPFTPLFIPTYQSLFPEYMLNVVSTETLVRDIAPITTEVYGFPHGREVGPPGGIPVQKWVTEYNLGIPKAAAVTLTTADKSHFHAKALLRSLVAMVSKGVSREYFFAAGPGGLSLISGDFFAALEAHPGTYPGDQQGGEVMSGFHNMLSRFQGPGPNAAPAQLKLVSIAQQGDHAQFTGDGTAAHPSLYDREVLAAFPFQTSPTHFVIPVYVMTRNLLTLYNAGAPTSDVTRYDLPDETFRITLGNLPETKAPPVVSAYDPLHDQSTPARLLTREGHTATFEMSATDYPRLLNVEYSGG